MFFPCKIQKAHFQIWTWPLHMNHQIPIRKLIIWHGVWDALGFDSTYAPPNPNEDAIFFPPRLKKNHFQIWMWPLHMNHQIPIRKLLIWHGVWFIIQNYNERCLQMFLLVTNQNTSWHKLFFQFDNWNTRTSWVITEQIQVPGIAHWHQVENSTVRTRGVHCDCVAPRHRSPKNGEALQECALVPHAKRIRKGAGERAEATLCGMERHSK